MLQLKATAATKVFPWNWCCFSDPCAKADNKENSSVISQVLMICFLLFPIPGGCRSVSSLTQMFMAVGWTMGQWEQMGAISFEVRVWENRGKNLQWNSADKASIYLAHSVYQCSRIK